MPELKCVHVGEYEIDGHSRVLEAGMVLTVEPGIYIPKSAMAVDETWRGIGIRIEDNIIVHQDGSLENLTRQAFAQSEVN